MKHVNRLIMALVYIFLYAPLLVMVIFSFSGGNHTSVFQVVEDRPFYYWYEQLFREGNPLLRCLWNSIQLGIVSALIATVLGTVAAVGIYRMKNRRLSSSMMMVNNIPMSVLYSSVIGGMEAGAVTTAALYATVIGSNLGAFFTPTGALAGIMWTGQLHDHGVSFSFTRFVRYGVTVAVPALIAALLGLRLCC